MRYTKILAALAAALCLLCACNTQKPPADYTETAQQTGTDYQSSWITGISKTDAAQNSAVADWLELCAKEERNDIGHYVLRYVAENADGTATYHLLLYRSATEYDAKSFDVSFSMDQKLLTVTPTYNSSDKNQYGYDLVYLCLTAPADCKLNVEMLVDGDYPGQIITSTSTPITPDTLGAK